MGLQCQKIVTWEDMKEENSLWRMSYSEGENKLWTAFKKIRRCARRRRSTRHHRGRLSRSWNGWRGGNESWARACDNDGPSRDVRVCQRHTCDQPYRTRVAITRRLGLLPVACLNVCIRSVKRNNSFSNKDRMLSVLFQKETKTYTRWTEELESIWWNEVFDFLQLVLK